MNYTRIAILSDDGMYRYSLTRVVGESGDSIVWIMLNPSTADAIEDDPTVRRIVRFTKDIGGRQATIVNLFALRSTDPKALRTAPDPVGPENDTYILNTCLSADKVICAWGTHGILHNRNQRVLDMLSARSVSTFALKTTKAGHPSHPLYLPASSRPYPFPSDQEPNDQPE